MSSDRSHTTGKKLLVTRNEEMTEKMRLQLQTYMNGLAGMPEVIALCNEAVEEFIQHSST